MIGWPSDHFQDFIVIVTVLLPFEKTGALARLSAELKVMPPAVLPNQYSGRHICSTNQKISCVVSSDAGNIGKMSTGSVPGGYAMVTVPPRTVFPFPLPDDGVEEPPEQAAIASPATRASTPSLAVRPGRSDMASSIHLYGGVVERPLSQPLCYRSPQNRHVFVKR